MRCEVMEVSTTARPELLACLYSTTFHVCSGITKRPGIHWSLLKEKYAFFSPEKSAVSYNKWGFQSTSARGNGPTQKDWWRTGASDEWVLDNIASESHWRVEVVRIPGHYLSLKVATYPSQVGRIGTNIWLQMIHAQEVETWCRIASMSTLENHHLTRQIHLQLMQISGEGRLSTTVC